MLHKAKVSCCKASPCGCSVHCSCGNKQLLQTRNVLTASVVHKAQFWLQQSTTVTSWVLLFGARQIEVLPFQGMI